MSGQAVVEISTHPEIERPVALGDRVRAQPDDWPRPGSGPSSASSSDPSSGRDRTSRGYGLARYVHHARRAGRVHVREAATFHAQRVRPRRAISVVRRPIRHPARRSVTTCQPSAVVGGGAHGVAFSDLEYSGTASERTLPWTGCNGPWSGCDEASQHCPRAENGLSLAAWRADVARPCVDERGTTR